MGNLQVKPSILNSRAEVVYDAIRDSLGEEPEEESVEILTIIQHQLRHVPKHKRTFHFTLNSKPINRSCLEAISHAIKVTDCVTRLSLESASLDGDAVAIIAAVLGDHEVLEEVYLSGNPIGYQGLRVLCEALQKSASITTLHVGQVACGDEGAAVLATMVQESSSLRILNASDNGITDEGFAQLDSAVRSNERIVQLDMLNNKVKKESLDSLAQLLSERYGPYLDEVRAKLEPAEGGKKRSFLKAAKGGSVGRKNRKGRNSNRGALSPRDSESSDDGALKSPKKPKSANSSPRGPGWRLRGEDLRRSSASDTDKDKNKLKMPNAISIEAAEEKGQAVTNGVKLRLHVIEARGFDKVSDFTFFVEFAGDTIKGKTAKKTEAPFWDQWLNLVITNVDDYKLVVWVHDKARGEVGRVDLRSWSLVRESEKWCGMGNGNQVMLGVKPSDELIAKFKKRLEEEAAMIASRNRPRGRTMLAAPATPVPSRRTNPELQESTLKIIPSKRFSFGEADTIGKRPTMEDATLVHGCLGGDESLDLFAVFDGHGSEKVAKYCCENFSRVFLEKRTEDLLESLKIALQALDEEVAEWAINMGCTAVVALIHGTTCYLANVGDTRAVIVKDTGRAERLTLDHKPTLPDEVKRIEALDGFVVNGRVQGVLAVSRAVGDANFRPWICCDPYLRKMELQEDHTHLIVACDGLWDVFPDSLAAQVAFNQPTAEKAAAMLRDRAFSSGSTDNISILVINLKEPPPANYVHKKEAPVVLPEPVATGTEFDDF